MLKSDHEQKHSGQSIKADYTHLLCKGKYHWTAYLLFNWFGFDQTNKSVAILT